MKHDEAVHEFDHHYSVASGEVIEHFGGPAEAYEYPTEEEAITAALQSLQKRTQEDIRKLESKLNSTEVKVRIFLAKFGLCNPDLVNRRVAEIRSELVEKLALLCKIQNKALRPVVKLLPTDIRMPALIPLGATVWCVEFAWPLLEDLRIKEFVVSERRLYGSSIRSRAKKDVGFDCSPTYVLREKGGAGSYTANYDRRDFSDPSIPCGSFTGVWMFLTLEAARSKALELADHLRASADRIAALLDKGESVV